MEVQEEGMEVEEEFRHNIIVGPSEHTISKEGLV